MSHEIDLIPTRYRERLKIKQYCNLFLITFVLLVLLTVILSTHLNNKNTSIQSRMTTLKHEQTINQQLQQTYNALLSDERQLKKSLEILQGLQGGTPVHKTMRVIDRVLNKNIWFLQWSFKRTREFVKQLPKTLQKGYFITIPKENSAVGKQQIWKLESTMEIKGQARDHSSFSLFVRDLLNQEEIDDVKIIDTQMSPYDETQVLDFNIVIVINNQLTKAHV